MPGGSGQAQMDAREQTMQFDYQSTLFILTLARFNRRVRKAG